MPNPTREIFWHLDTWMQVAFYVTSLVAIGVFLYGFWRRLAKYRRGRRENRFDRLPRRIWRALKTILLNTTVRKRERFGGLAHSLILWGFVLLFIGTCIVIVD